MPQKRLLGVAAVLTSGVAAGIIESRSGKASVTPIPRKNVRRGKCFLVMKAISVSPNSVGRVLLFGPGGSKNQDPPYGVVFILI
jgi:hypothetical protein